MHCGRLKKKIKKCHAEISLTNLIEIVKNTTLSTPRVNFKMLSEIVHENEEIDLERIKVPKSQLLTVHIDKCNGIAFKIVLRFDKLFFNNKNVSMLINDLANTMQTGKTSELPFEFEKSNADNLLSLLKDTEEKRLFWKGRLSAEIKPIYVSSELYHSTEGDLIIRRVKLNDNVKIITKWTSDRSIPMRDLFLSVYQILLKFITENDSISVITNFRNDFHGPELLLPIVTHFTNDDITVGEFIECVSEEIKLVSQNCLPHENLISGHSDGHIFSNALFVDTYNFNALPGVFDQQMGVFSVDNRYKTVIRIMDDLEGDWHVDFQCPTNIADDKIATNLLVRLIELTETFVKNDKLSLKQLHKGLQGKMEKRANQGNNVSERLKTSPIDKPCDYTFNGMSDYKLL